jgi:hypothetical protein
VREDQGPRSIFYVGIEIMSKAAGQHRMKKGEVLKVQLVNRMGKHIRIARVSVDVVFYVQGNERYRFDAGRTGSSGVCVAAYRMFESGRVKNQKLLLMDYNTRLEDCDPEVLIHVPPLSELKARYNAVKKWFPASAPQRWLRLRTSNNARIVAEDVRAKLSGRSTTSVQIACELVHDPVAGGPL